jgi:hypothetical protein
VAEDCSIIVLVTQCLSVALALLAIDFSVRVMVTVLGDRHGGHYRDLKSLPSHHDFHSLAN